MSRRRNVGLLLLVTGVEGKRARDREQRKRECEKKKRSEIEKRKNRT